MGSGREHPAVDALGLFLQADARKNAGYVHLDHRWHLLMAEDLVEEPDDALGLARFKVEIGQVAVERPIGRLVAQQFFDVVDGPLTVAFALQDPNHQAAQPHLTAVQCQALAHKVGGHVGVVDALVVVCEAGVDGGRSRVEVGCVAQDDYRAEVVVLGFKNLGLDEVLHGLIGAQRLCRHGRVMAPQTRAAAPLSTRGRRAGGGCFS